MAKRIKDEEMRFSIVVNGNEAQKELYKLDQSTRKLKATNKELKAERRKLYREGKRGTAEYKRLSKEINKNSAVIKENDARMKVLQERIGLTGLTMKQLRGKAKQLRTALHNMVPGSAQYKRYENDLKQVNARINKLRVSSRRGRKGLSSLAQGFNKYAALGASVIATGTGIVLSMQQMIDYNGKLSDAQANVRKTTGLTEDEVEELTKSFGMFTTRTARIELLKLSEEAGRLGITGVKNIQDFVKVANKMNVALGDELTEEQIRDVGKMTKIYKVGERTGRGFAEAMESLGSSINQVSASGSAQSEFLVDYLKRQSGIAQQTKVSAEQNVGYAATFDEIGQRVRVSATAMNKVFIDMFSDTKTYADIAQMSLSDFTNLLNTDANEAMIKFLKGLQGNNEGLQTMVGKLKDLDAGGSNGVAALAALSKNTDLLRKNQELAAGSLKKNISLTNEYNLKNNNLAGTLEKIGKKIRGYFSSRAVSGFLNRLATGFGKLIGAVKSADKAFKEETETTYKNSKAAKRLANESSELLREYQDLTEKGVKPTAKQKKRLEEITLQLRDRLGESVVAIDTETGALKLNTKEVRKQIKLKRIAADEEASTLASRLIGAKNEKKEQQKKLPALQKEYEIRKRLADKAREEYKNSQEYQRKTRRGKLAAVAQLPEVKKEQEAFLKLNGIKGKVNEQERRRLDILKKLKALNYSEADIEEMYKPEKNKDAGPSEGQHKLINGVLMVYKNGKWVPVVGGGGPEGDHTEKTAANLDKEEQELREIRRRNAEARAKLKKDEFQKELALEDQRFTQKIAKLQGQLTKENELREIARKANAAKAKGDEKKYNFYNKLYALRKEKNAAINREIETEDKTHQYKVGKILENAEADQINTAREKYERERDIRETAFNNQLAGIKTLGEAKELLRDDLSAKELSKIRTLQDAKEALTKQHQKKELTKQGEYLKETVAQFKKILGTGKFKGFDLSAFGDDVTDELKKKLEKLKKLLSEIRKEKDKLQGNDTSEKGELSGGDEQITDIFGMTADDWSYLFENIKKGENLIASMSKAAGILTQTWQAYSDMKTAQENRDYQKFEKRIDKRKQREERLLNQGLINRRQYDAAVEGLEKKKQKKKAELEYKQAKRNKEISITKAVISTALAVMQAYAQLGPIAGSIAAALMTATGAFQVATIAAQPLPAKGYKEGFYPVEREQDGRLFEAEYAGYSRSGLVKNPSLFLAGEEGPTRPEMIISGTDYSNFAPDFKDSLHREIARVKGYQDGFVQNGTKADAFNSENTTDSNSLDYALFAKALNRNSEIMEKIETSGLQAYLVRSQQNARDLQEDIKKYNKTRNSAKI